MVSRLTVREQAIENKRIGRSTGRALTASYVSILVSFPVSFNQAKQLGPIVCLCDFLIVDPEIRLLSLFALLLLFLLLVKVPLLNYYFVWVSLVIGYTAKRRQKARKGTFIDCRKARTLSFEKISSSRSIGFIHYPTSSGPFHCMAPTDCSR